MPALLTQSVCDRCGKGARKPGYTLCARCLDDNVVKIPMYDWIGQNLDTNQQPGIRGDLTDRLVKLAAKLCAVNKIEAAKQVISILDLTEEEAAGVGAKVAKVIRTHSDSPNPRYVFVEAWLEDGRKVEGVMDRETGLMTGEGFKVIV